MDVEIISKIMTRPVIWNKMLRSHSNRNFLDVAWREISEEMHLEGFLSFASLTSPERRPLVASQLHHMKSVMSQLRSQQVDPTEYSCLKALALFRPEAQGLRDPLQVELLQDQTQLMLHEYVLTRQAPPSKVRFGRLLLALSQVRRVTPSLIEEVFFRRTIGSVPIERLLCDMFRS